MLSWSIGESNQRVDLLPIAHGEGDPLLPGGRQLISFVNATLTGSDVPSARAAVEDALGPAATVDAAGVVGNFEMMNRIADGVGMPVVPGTRRRMEPVIQQLGLAGFPHA